MRMVGVLLGLSLAAGCASSSSHKASSQTAAMPQGQPVWSSNEAGNRVEAGRLSSATGHQLVVTPYDESGMKTFALRHDTPVFFGPGVPATKSIAPGSDVRVFYRADAGGEQKVVALEVLNPEDAAKLKSSGTQSGTTTTPDLGSQHELGTQPGTTTTPDSSLTPGTTTTPDTNITPDTNDLQSP